MIFLLLLPLVGALVGAYVGYLLANPRKLPARAQHYLADRWGWWAHDGLFMSVPDAWPRGYVVYEGSKRMRSLSMPLGNAYRYAHMFKGEVIIE